MQVATIAANGDEHIGKMITEAFEKAIFGQCYRIQLVSRHSAGGQGWHHHSAIVPVLRNLGVTLSDSLFSLA